MICNTKLQSLFDAALRATEEPNVKQHLAAPLLHTLPDSDVQDMPAQGESFDERSILPLEPISFAPAFWKTAL